MTRTTRARIASDQLAEVLTPIVQRMLPGAERARIINWTVATNGFSTETCLFEVTDMDGPDVALVFRRPPQFAVLPEFDLRRQYLTMQRLADSPVPVPRMRWIDTDGTELGTPYFVMDQIQNVRSVDVLPCYQEAGIFADADASGRAKLWNGCIDIMAATHCLDPEQYRLGFLDLRDYGSTPPQRLSTYLRYAVTWASGDRPLDPRFVRAMDWLDDHLYIPDRVSVCWGDARMSNVLYRPDLSVAAALDWEISYLGDPAADLAWLLLTDWASSPLPGRASAEGTPDRAETLDYYEQRTGFKVGDMRFCDLSAALLLAVPLLRLNLKFAVPDVDLGAICAERIELLLDGD